MKPLLVVFSLAGLLACSVATAEPARHMAVTIDDLPVGPPGRHSLAQQRQVTDALLETLASRNVPAIGFVNEDKMEVDGTVDPARVALLESWLEAGMALGNHGHSHLSLHRVDPDEWMADVLRGERITRALVESRGESLTWFRHPFLHAGLSPEIQRRTADFLAEHGYRIAPVTIDNGEWIYADAYADAWNRDDQALMRRLGQDYVRYMLEVVAFYEDQAEQIIGEPIPHTLLIHANALNAHWLDDVLDALAGRGYQWIDIESATRHPAYRRAIHGYTGPAGITWLHRWAITAEMDRSIFRGEPEVPEWVVALRAVEEPAP